MGFLTVRQRGDLGVQTRIRNMQLQIAANPWVLCWQKQASNFT